MAKKDREKMKNENEKEVVLSSIKEDSPTEIVEPEEAKDIEVKPEDGLNQSVDGKVEPTLDKVEEVIEEVANNKEESSPIEQFKISLKSEDFYSCLDIIEMYIKSLNKESKYKSLVGDLHKVHVTLSDLTHVFHNISPEAKIIASHALKLYEVIKW